MKQNILLFIFLVFCFSFAQIANAQGIIKDDFLVNDDVGSADQSVPSISMDAAGNFVIVWYDFRNANWDIYYQRYSDAGTVLGVNTKVNDDTQDASQEHPSISMDATGNFVIVWDDNRNNNNDIYYQRYTSTGGALGVNTKVNDDAGSDFQMYPSISMDAAGNFVVGWQDYRNTNWDIYIQRFTSTGSTLEANTKVNDDIDSIHQKLPSISTDGVGNFIIVWQDNRHGQYNPDIFAQRYFSNGNPNGANYRIVADGPNEGESSPVVIANSSNINFSWQDNRRSEGWDIYSKIVGWNWNGVPTVIDEGNVNSIDFSLSQNYPNPFNPITTIRFSIPEPQLVALKVYDPLGNEVATLVNEYKPAGSYEIEFNTSTIKHRPSSGIYFYQLKVYPANGGAGNFVETKKMILLK